MEENNPDFDDWCTAGAHGWIIHPVGGLRAQRQVRDGETLDYWGTAGTKAGKLTSSLNLLSVLL